MKTSSRFAILFLAVLACAGIAFAAYLKSPARVQRIQMDLALAPDGTVTAVNLTGFIQTKRIANDADPADVVEAPWQSVSFDLLTIGNTTAAGKTADGQQVAALLRKMVLDQATAKGVQ